MKIVKYIVLAVTSLAFFIPAPAQAKVQPNIPPQSCGQIFGNNNMVENSASKIDTIEAVHAKINVPSAAAGANECSRYNDINLHVGTQGRFSDELDAGWVRGWDCNGNYQYYAIAYIQFFPVTGPSQCYIFASWLSLGTYNWVTISRHDHTNFDVTINGNTFGVFDMLWSNYTPTGVDSTRLYINSGTTNNGHWQNIAECGSSTNNVCNGSYTNFVAEKSDVFDVDYHLQKDSQTEWESVPN